MSVPGIQVGTHAGTRSVGRFDAWHPAAASPTGTAMRLAGTMLAALLIMGGALFTVRPEMVSGMVMSMLHAAMGAS